MKIGEIRGMPLEEARKQVQQARDELAKERATVAGGTRPENPGRIGNLRKTIARLLTVIREKEPAEDTEKAHGKLLVRGPEAGGPAAGKAKEAGKKAGWRKKQEKREPVKGKRGAKGRR